MKLLKPIKTIEVRRAFVVANIISSRKDRRRHLNLISKKVFIDDGCMRSIALTISGQKVIRAYIGLPKK